MKRIAAILALSFALVASVCAQQKQQDQQGPDYKPHPDNPNAQLMITTDPPFVYNSKTGQWERMDFGRNPIVVDGATPHLDLDPGQLRALRAFPAAHKIDRPGRRKAHHHYASRHRRPE
ncbi:MAG TPA: hypothetical protein VI756_10790 [Blastocatellia bacterium]